MPTWMGLGFQDSGSPFFSFISYLHDHVMMIMLVVVVFISYLLMVLLINNSFYKFFSESTLVETIWSVVPAFLLMVLVLPSMQILYMMEDIKSPSYTFKVVAHQWYWTYVSPLWGNFYFLSDKAMHTYSEVDSMLESTSMFPRLLGSTSSLYVPVGLTSRFLVTSTDVIHSFALPSMALKVDAMPGRMNQIFIFPMRCGIFFGQCSEICGSNHSFMPISLKVVSHSNFLENMTSVLLNDVLNLSHLKL
uniref:Cytochrome c oxidase subunit 2 n=1 Tax=Histiostomatidae sp. XFX TaxID=2652661 RepID=A0A5J6VCY9_9ACAR|nr:cytochrome oxidase subunit 2 [Histiostomatidae sp. XFX]